MKHLLYFLAVMIGLSVHADAQTSMYHTRWTSVGRVSLLQTNFGICGYDIADSKGGLIYPRADGWQYLFASGMWFGGLVRVDNNLRHRVITTYEPTSGTSSAVPGELKNGRRPRADLATQYHVQQRLAGGIEVLSSRYHLGDSTRYQGADRSLMRGLSDIDIREWTYAFEQEDMADIIIRRFEFINTGLDTVFFFVPAWVLDPDVGDPSTPKQAAQSDIHFGIPTDDSTYFYIVQDEDESLTGELGFVVLESPNSGRVQTVTGGYDFVNKTEHLARYEAMTSYKTLESIGPTDVIALYAMDKVLSFRPGDTLRYTTAFVLMSPSEHQRRINIDGPEIKKYYNEAATRIRSWLADLPTSVEEAQSSKVAIGVAPHPITDQWTLRAPTSTAWDVSIYSLDGQLIQRFTTAADGTAQGPALASGVYHVVMTNANERHSRVVVRTP